MILLINGMKYSIWLKKDNMPDHGELTKWVKGKTVNSRRIYYHKGTDMEELVRAKANERVKAVVKRTSALIQKEAIDGIKLVQSEIAEQLNSMNIDNVDVHAKLAALQLLSFQETMEMLNDLQGKEMKKKRQNQMLLQWCISQRVQLIKSASGELRKLNNEQFEMKFGKKRLNVNVEAKGKFSWKDFTETEPKKIIEVEQEEVVDTDTGEENNISK
jgi:hypothetical protein